MQSRIESWLERQGVTRVELGRVLGQAPSYVSRKVRGERRWTLDDIQRSLSYFSERLGRPVTYDETFAPDTAPELVAPGAAEAGQ